MKRRWAERSLAVAAIPLPVQRRVRTDGREQFQYLIKGQPLTGLSDPARGVRRDEQTGGQPAEGRPGVQARGGGERPEARGTRRRAPVEMRTWLKPRRQATGEDERLSAQRWSVGAMLGDGAAIICMRREQAEALDRPDPRGRGNAEVP